MTQIKKIVLVHGGFVDGSGWPAVYDLLKADGYDVAVVQNPTLTLEDDVAADEARPRRSGGTGRPRRPLYGGGHHGSGRTTRSPRSSTSRPSRGQG